MTVGHAIWPDLLSDAERAQLSPGIPDTLDRSPDVLVVGGGILGVTIALTCSALQLGSIVLLERETLGAGASGGAAGQLLPAAHLGIDPPLLVELMDRGLAGWRSLHRAMPGGLGLIDLSWLGLERGGHQFAAGLPAGGRSLSAADVAQLVPGLAEPTPGVQVGDQARLNPLQAIARIAATLPGIASGVAVQRITVRDARIATIATSAGEFRPGVVIFATGNPPQLDGLRLNLPWSEVKGHMLVTEPFEVALPGSVAPLATTIDDGRLMIGGTHDVGDAERVVRRTVTATMRTQLARAWPLAAHLRVSHQWACFRPAHPDHLPVVDRVPGLDNAWLTSGHYKTGILLAPATAAALASWVRTDQCPPEVAALGVARFSQG